MNKTLVLEIDCPVCRGDGWYVTDAEIRHGCEPCEGGGKRRIAVWKPTCTVIDFDKDKTLPPENTSVVYYTDNINEPTHTFVDILLDEESPYQTGDTLKVSCDSPTCNNGKEINYKYDCPHCKGTGLMQTDGLILEEVKLMTGYNILLNYVDEYHNDNNTISKLCTVAKEWLCVAYVKLIIKRK